MTLNKNNRSNNTVNNVVFRGVASIMEKQNGTWVGTMTQLNNALNGVLDIEQKNVLPRSPSALRVVINRVVNRLRNRGFSVRFGRTSDHSRTRFVKFAQ